MNSIPKNLKNDFYAVLQDSKIEINQLKTQYDFFGNINLIIDIDKIKEKSCQKFFQLTKLNLKDQKNSNIIDYIKSKIDEEYNTLTNKLKTDIISIQSKSVIQKIIKIIKNPQKDISSENSDDYSEDFDNEYDYGLCLTMNSLIDMSLDEEYDDIIEEEEENELEEKALIQTNINKLLDKTDQKFIFDKKKLNNIGTSKTKLAEILCSLNTIKKNPKLELFYKEKEKPYKYVIYSNKSNYPTKPIANILLKNCYFVSLYGKSSCTNSYLSILLKNNINKAEINELITVYGPINIMSYAKNIPKSFEKIKKFNIDQPNLYFIEISSEGNDPIFNKWCKYISFISHAIVYCSDQQKNIQEYAKFLNLLNDHESKKKIIDIKSLNEDLLRDKILDNIIEQLDNFFPHETAANYSYLFLSKNQTLSQLSSDISQFKTKQAEFYTLQLMNDSISYTKKLVEKSCKKLYSMINSNQIIQDSDFDKELIKIIEQAEEFLFVNSYQNFWNNKLFLNILADLTQEIKKEFGFSIKKLKQIIDVQKMIQILKNKLSASQYNLSEKEKSLFNQIKVMYSLNKYNLPESIDDLKGILLKLNKIYQESNDYEEEEMIKSIEEQLYAYLNENPIASDKEYGIFYSQLYNQYFKKYQNSLVSNSFQYAVEVRYVDLEYQIEKFNIVIDKELFEFAGVKIDNSSLDIDLPFNTTCHQLYELVRDQFNIKDIPFYITKYAKNKSIFSQVEVFEDDINISKLKSKSFRVNYGLMNKISTRTFLQSMVVRKIIMIDKDFTIRTSSKESIFNVDYDKNHHGWFNVVFNITTPDPKKSFGQDGGVLIYLKLNDEEISYLKEGNALVHQSFKDGKWITEEDPVFLSYPKCNTAVILLRHCSDQQLVPVETQVNELIPDNFINKEHSRDWDKEDESIQYTRGGRPYFLPKGYNGIGLKVDKSTFDNTCVGFHGTKPHHIKGIVKEGFILPSKEHDVEPGHFKLGKTVFGEKNFPANIFCSPSIKIANLYSSQIFAKTNCHLYVESGSIYQDFVRFFIFQCRVKPKAIKVYPNTNIMEPITDFFKSDEMEWAIKDPSNITPYRLLYREIKIENYICDYRAKKAKK